MIHNFRAWSSELNRLKVDLPKKTVADALLVLGKRALEGLVYRSPVGNPALWIHPAPPGYVPGTFKNSWSIGIGSVPSSTRRSPDRLGGGSLAEAGKLDALHTNPYVTVYIGNDVPYAWRIEHGWSSQAPAGVVAVTVQSLRVV